MRQVQFEGITDSEKNDFINFIYGQLKEREAQNEALHVKLDAQMERFDKLQATLDAISSQLAESNKMKVALQKGFDNMHTQLEQMKDELVKAQKELVPMQPGDVPTTYADATALERDFGFTPKITLREGLRKFAEWYKQYYR